MASMPSHLSTIGFDVADQNALLDLVNRLAPDAVAHATARGTYLQWSDTSGAELWMQIDASGALIGLQPHFRGDAQLLVRITDRVESNSDVSMDGAFHAWADPGPAEDDGGAYPFVFEAPDFGLHDGLVLPRVATAQVAAFALQVEVYASPEAFDAAPSDGPRFASQSFIPSSLFADGGGGAEAYFAGHVRHASLRVNAVTGRSFHACVVATLGGDYDVVIDPELVSRAPVAGSVVQGTFWLSGRVEDWFNPTPTTSRTRR